MIKKYKHLAFNRLAELEALDYLASQGFTIEFETHGEPEILDTNLAVLVSRGPCAVELRFYFMSDENTWKYCILVPDKVTVAWKATKYFKDIEDALRKILDS